MEEDDPVVQEIPVFLSKTLAENLFIYQYPSRPANREWNDVEIVNAAVKPKNQMVRLEVGLDVNSDKFCSSVAEQIAINTDGHQESTWHTKEKEKEKSIYFKNRIMDKIVYESSRPCTDTRHYAVAILEDKELHCTPLQGIIQMRQSYAYHDKQEKRKQDKKKADDPDEEETEQEPQQVTVKFARQETDVAKKAREKSYESLTQRMSSEPWYDAYYRNPESDRAELERMKLFSQVTADGSALSLNSHEYIRNLVPSPPEDEADVVPTKRLSVVEQIKNLLINAKLMTLSDIRALVRTETGAAVTESAAVSALCGVACCVRGVWAARSGDLYPRPAPAPPALLAAARDHILYLFTQNTYIDRRKVTAAVRLPPLDVLEIIRSVAKYNPRYGWELLIPPDLEFEKKYPDVIQRQNLAWEAKQRQFTEMLMGENVPKRQRKKSQRDSVSSDVLLSPKPRCNSVSEEDSDRKRHKNKCASGSGKRTRNISSSSVTDGT